VLLAEHLIRQHDNTFHQTSTSVPILTGRESVIPTGEVPTTCAWSWRSASGVASALNEFA
jgi:hypothetical protein